MCIRDSIKDVNENTVVLSDGQRLKVSRRRKKEILERISEYVRRYGRFA